MEKEKSRNSSTPLLDAKVQELLSSPKIRFKDEIVWERAMWVIRDYFTDMLGRPVNADYGHWDDCEIKIAISQDEAIFLESKLRLLMD